MMEFFTSGAICSLNSQEILIGWGERTWSAFPLSFPTWFVPDFFLLDQKPFLHFSKTKKISIQDLSLPETGTQSMEFSSPDWAPFEDFFSQFKQSDLEKVVPYAQKKAKASVNVGAVLKSCLKYQKAHPNTAIYGFWNQTEGILGVTPEWLFVMQEGSLKSVACAGTSCVEKAGLMLQDPKLLKEHQIVIQGLKEDLEPFGQVKIGTTEVKGFSKIAHLMTPIEVRGVKGSFKDLIAKVHPSPALGAFPKEKGLEFLRKYALTVPRKRFGAPFGVLEAEDKAVLHVAIRNIQWQNEDVMMLAGSGIIASSRLEEEKNEICAKFNAIQEIIGI